MEEMKTDFEEEMDRVEKGYLEELRCVKEDHLKEMEEVRGGGGGGAGGVKEADIEFLQERHEIELRQIEEAYR